MWNNRTEGCTREDHAAAVVEPAVQHLNFSYNSHIEYHKRYLIWHCAQTGAATATKETAPVWAF